MRMFRIYTGLLLCAALVLAGCATTPETAKIQGSGLPKPGAKIALATVGNKSDVLFEYDVEDLLRDSVQTALSKENLSADIAKKEPDFTLSLFLITPEAQLLSHRVVHTEPEAKRGDRDGQESGSVSERAQFAEVFETIRYRRAMPRCTVPVALARGLCLPRMRAHRLLRDRRAESVSVLPLPPPDLADQRDDLRVHQIAVDDLVPRDVFPDPTEERDLGVGAQAAIGHRLQCRLAYEAQAAPGNEGARRQPTSSGVYPAR